MQIGDKVIHNKEMCTVIDKGTGIVRIKDSKGKIITVDETFVQEI